VNSVDMNQSYTCMFAAFNNNSWIFKDPKEITDYFSCPRGLEDQQKLIDQLNAKIVHRKPEAASSVSSAPVDLSVSDMPAAAPKASPIVRKVSAAASKAHSRTSKRSKLSKIDELSPMKDAALLALVPLYTVVQTGSDGSTITDIEWDNVLLDFNIRTGEPISKTSARERYQYLQKQKQAEIFSLDGDSPKGAAQVPSVAGRVERSRKRRLTQ